MMRKRINCPTCGKAVFTNSLARHQRSHAAGSHVCIECGATFKNTDGLKRHLFVKHAPASEQPLACPQCDQRFARGDQLDAHRARVHLDATREQLGESCTQLEKLHTQLAAVQAKLLDTQTTVARLQEEGDRLRAASALQQASQEANADGLGDNLEQLAGRLRGRVVLRCPCLRFDSSRLGELRRCSTPQCSSAFHWVCAGYGRPLAPDAVALCARCLAASPFPAVAYEDASNEVVLLDAYLAARGLRREPVAADGLCLFTSVARAINRSSSELLQETMHSLSLYDFHALDPTINEADAVALRHEAASLASRRLRMGQRWNRRLLDFAFIVLVRQFNLSCIEARGRCIREDPEDHRSVSGRICCYGRGIGLDHYDAVVAFAAPKAY